MLDNEKGKLPPPWQWPGLWTLNLPALAVTWQVLFAHAFSVQLALYHHLVLAGLVWVFVVLERWIFCFRLHPGVLKGTRDPAELQIQSGSILRIGGVVLFAIACTLYYRSSVREAAGTLLLSSAGGAYLLSLFRQTQPEGDYLPREMILAGFISAAVFLFIWANAVFSPMKILLPGLLFLLLLFYYFCLVARWTKPLLPSIQGTSLLETQLGGLYRGLPLFMIFAGAALALVAGDLTSNTLLLAIAVSALILLLLEAWQPYLSRQQARGFADLALLAPLVPILLLL